MDGTEGFDSLVNDGLSIRDASSSGNGLTSRCVKREDTCLATAGHEQLIVVVLTLLHLVNDLLSSLD